MTPNVVSPAYTKMLISSLIHTLNTLIYWYIWMAFAQDEQAALVGESTRLDCCERIMSYFKSRRTKERKEQSLPLLNAPQDQSTTDGLANGVDNLTERQSETVLD